MRLTKKPNIRQLLLQVTPPKSSQCDLLSQVALSKCSKCGRCMKQYTESSVFGCMFIYWHYEYKFVKYKRTHMNMNKKSMSILVAALLFTAIVTPFTYWLIKRTHTKTGTVVIIKGTSSVGKTSIINELKKIYGDTYKVLNQDAFVASYKIAHPIKEKLEAEPDGKEKQKITTDYQQALHDSFYVAIKENALQGKNVFVDIVPNYKKYEQNATILKDIKPINVLVYCPLEITLARVEERNKTGKPEEKREAIDPIAQYSFLYKPQESPTEPVVDTVSSKDIKQLFRTVIDSHMPALPVEFREKEYKNFVQQFKLDEQEEVIIVPESHYDLILDCKQSPKDLAKEIMKFLKQQR